MSCLTAPGVDGEVSLIILSSCTLTSCNAAAVILAGTSGTALIIGRPSGPTILLGASLAGVPISRLNGSRLFSAVVRARLMASCIAGVCISSVNVASGSTVCAPAFSKFCFDVSRRVSLAAANSASVPATGPSAARRAASLRAACSAYSVGISADTFFSNAGSTVPLTLDAACAVVGTLPGTSSTLG